MDFFQYILVSQKVHTHQSPHRKYLPRCFFVFIFLIFVLFYFSIWCWSYSCWCYTPSKLTSGKIIYFTSYYKILTNEILSPPPILNIVYHNICDRYLNYFRSCNRLYRPHVHSMMSTLQIRCTALINSIKFPRKICIYWIIVW